MDAVAEQRRIRELESLRRQARLFRLFFFIACLGVVFYCLYQLHRSVTALATAGPEQDAYMKSLQVNLDKDVIPRLRSAASETLTEVQPEVTAAIKKLGPRMPEVTAVAKNEMEALQTDLPNKGEAILNASYTNLLQAREPTLRAEFGNDVTDDQVKALIVTLTQEGHTQLVAANNELFAPHQLKLKHILQNLQSIKDQEAPNVKKIQPSWDMAILLLDILREDMKDLEKNSKSDEATATPAPTPTPATPQKKASAPEKKGKA